MNLLVPMYRPWRVSFRKPGPPEPGVPLPADRATSPSAAATDESDVEGFEAGAHRGVPPNHAARNA
jgi:hypothetical protein